LTTHNLTSHPTNMTKLGSKDYLILPTVRTWLPVIFVCLDVSGIVLRTVLRQ
jgi:hypothetical protein